MLTPFVSVILPVYNDCERLSICLQALEQQTYPKEFYEVIVVDNNSSEDLAFAVEFKQVKLEFEATPGSYAARNKGISVAKGEVFAFIDSDCRPQPHWIESGVEALQSESADLIGGNVKFTFSADKTMAEIYDSKTNMQIKQNIETRKVSKTANLFVYKHVFNSIGLFPSHLKSGGDVAWTKLATDSGFKLVYSEKAEVFHPARKLLALLSKQYRVGGGQPHIWLQQGETPEQVIQKIKASFWPPNLREVRAKYPGNPKEHKVQFLSFWMVFWLCKLATNFGRLNTILRGLKARQNGTV
jgi:glycosyltransferase involved in cell wall biosynthesis